MKVALIGIGLAGGRIVEALSSYESNVGVDFVADALAVNTARADLVELERLPENRRILVGQSRVKGHGVGADNELGAEVTREDIGDVLSVVDEFSTHEVDAFVVVAGLGGGTGSGGAPVVANELRRVYSEPVLGVGVLPDRSEGDINTLNAARSFPTFVREVDNLLLFDNDAWRQSGESVSDNYATLNRELARRLGVLFSAGETKTSAGGDDAVGTADVLETLETGGVSTVGYANVEVRRPNRGLVARLFGSPPERDEAKVTNRVTALVRRAMLGRLTAPCDRESAKRGLVVVAGPPEELSHRGIERGRAWVEEETGSAEIRGGAHHTGADFVAAVVLLSGTDDVPRVAELRETAIETRRDIIERESTSSHRYQNLIRASEEGDEESIDPLF
ncbi:Cell division GTPase FtsZ [Halopelagius inordinatus]|uniref:Tubulin-like protein CetZ n=1 Tax=Halopelagius inordinatus TaxID=553467 RepID=A0A1I2N885_9EURY|nr:tubulin/FtsZ family protein [Halopelagius inordinatus]SFF97947.1 Cell division GTPase FtsZ [Halopelagius inordinatus]